jgi:hypothetical protein
MKTPLALTALLFLVVRTMQAVADDKPTSLADARAAVEANLRTPGGKAYDQQLGKEFPQKYLDTMKQCKQSAGNDLAEFWMLIKLDKGGAVQDVRPCRIVTPKNPPPLGVRSLQWVSIHMKLAH